MGSSSSIPPRGARPIPLPSERLDSWKEIAHHLKRDVRTVQRWEHTRGLPVHRLPGGGRSTIYALRSELDAWWTSRGVHLAQEEAAQAAAPPAARRWALWAAGLAALLVVAGIALYRFFPRHPPPPQPRLTPLTSYSGGVYLPSFSPDGKEVVFVWSGPKQDNFDIYVKRIGADEPQRLTRNPAGDILPAWSPDGTSIAFVRWRPGATTVQVLAVPARGGAERLLCEGPNLGFEPLPAMSWTPDSRRLIVSCSDPPSPPGLCVCPDDTGEHGRPNTASLRSPGYHSPVFSPDGKKLAFIRSSNVFLTDLNPDYTPRGQPRQLTHEPCCVSNPMWTGDSREILYVKHGEYMPTLLRIPADGSRPPQPVTSVGLLGTHLAISRQGDKLVYVSGSMDSDIWRVELPVRPRPTDTPLPAVRYLSSSRMDEAPHISPDGTRVAFHSSRSGSMEIWVAQADGSDSFQLTSFGGPAAVAPRWSPDGKEIVFRVDAGGGSDLYVVSATGGQPRRLTWGGIGGFPSWSRDGRWIYFGSSRSGVNQCWKIPSGGGEPVQVTRGGGGGGFESPDGRFLYYFVRGQSGGAVWRVPVAGGEEQPVAETLRGPLNIAVSAEGIYTVSWADYSLPGFLLRFYRFATGKSEVVGRINATLGTGLAVSPDGRWLLFTDFEARRGDLVLVENFR